MTTPEESFADEVRNKAAESPEQFLLTKEIYALVQPPNIGIFLSMLSEPDPEDLSENGLICDLRLSRAQSEQLLANLQESLQSPFA